jgi:putative protein kinase ArgK-like GTPase of G3E family
MPDAEQTISTSRFRFEQVSVDSSPLSFYDQGCDLCQQCTLFRHARRDNVFLRPMAEQDHSGEQTQEERNHPCE